jgi:cytochrome c oxidase cbb3-type subunit I/II
MVEHGPARTETFVYDDAIVRWFGAASLAWGLLGMLVGIIIAHQLLLPEFLSEPWLNFGRIRPLHTNLMIFAFATNAVFAAVYFTTQRLCKTRMCSDGLGRLHFWGWQIIVVAAVLTLPRGITQTKEYAELEWPIDLAIVIVWVIFAFNFFATLFRRRERYLYITLWFYIATIIGFPIVYVINSLVVTNGFFQSDSIYAGVEDAFMQWWYGRSMFILLLMMPFLGIMYYFLPKAANRPLFSYRLAIVHFWALVLLAALVGPIHLHYTSLPDWASSLGMVFAIMLWMPSWGGLINGLLTVRGARPAEGDAAVLRFFIGALVCYGVVTLGGPLLSVKTVNALSHYTDWTIAHAHVAGLGWVGLMIFGMVYYLMPRLFQTPIWSHRLVTVHLWCAVVGIPLYAVSVYAAGITQGLMLGAVGTNGLLVYGDFVETLVRIRPLYWIRLLGGSFYMLGVMVCIWNFIMTWRNRPTRYETPVQEAPNLERDYVDPPLTPSRLKAVTDIGRKMDVLSMLEWHRRWERRPVKFMFWIVAALVIAALIEIVPLVTLPSTVQAIPTVRPYTPLELVGRDVYTTEGCFYCHSQMIRPIYAETQRYGAFSRGGEFVYDHPFQWGSRRVGPDLQRVGGKYSYGWLISHLRDPRALVEGSNMPSYEHLLERHIDLDAIDDRIAAMIKLGVPYGIDELRYGTDLAREQARSILEEVIGQDGPEAVEEDWESTQMVALVAYLQRLGTDVATAAPETGQ